MNGNCGAMFSKRGIVSREGGNKMMPIHQRTATGLRSAAIAASLVATVAMSAAPADAAAWQPTRPVTFIVPAGTGGGADQMARFLQGVVSKNKLMSQPIVVVNKSGGAGAEGFLDVKGSKGDADKII